MSLYGSQRALDRTGSRGDLTGGMTQQYARSEVIRGSGNGYEPYLEGYNSYTFSKSSMGGMGGGMMGGGGGGGGAGGMVMSSSGGGGGMMMGGGGGSGMMMGGGGGSGMMMGGGGGGGGGMLMSGGGGGGGGMMMSSGGGGGGMISSQMSSSNLGSIHQRAMILQGQCQDYLKRADHALQGGNSGEAERYMVMAKETIEQLKSCAMDLRQMGQPNETVIRTVEFCRDQLKGVHMAISGTLTRRRSTRGSSGGWEEPPRSFQDAMGWIGQQKRLIETASWGDDPAAIDQQLISHQRFHSSIQRSSEMDRARDELRKKGDKGNLHALEQEWDSLQKLSFGRTQQLQDLQKIIQEMSREIMWVNDTEEEELVFDWGDKNIDQYIPKKQESYSKLMSNLEEKEKDLNKLKGKVDTLLKNNHPAADKIEAYKDTLQTQWSWLLQITKCIDTHLKENSAYSQFFKEANETYSALQKEHETVRKNFVCDKNTSLEDLLGLLRGLEREKEKIMENKRQVQHLVNRSKNIVRLKPRNPEEKSSSPVMVKALCDFKQDQKIICKNDEAILRDNSQRSKWNVTGPGGLEMDIPSVCLIVPPPNPISVSLANKNEQYYEAILSIWNQLYINVKSLVAWQYCVLDIKHINSLTISMLAKMRPEEYRQIIKNLETHFDEFKVSCVGSQMFADEDKRTIESQFSGAQDHYETLVVQLPTYIVQGEIEVQQAAELQHQQGLILLQQQQQAAAEAEARRLEEEARRLEEERRRAELRRQEEKRAEAARREAAKKEACRRDQEIKKETLKLSKAESARKKAAVSSSHSLTELHALRLRLDGAEDTLGQHIHICLGDDGVHDCGLKISQLEIVQGDVDSMRAEFLRLRDRIMKELEGMCDSDKAQFLRSEVGIINQRLGSLESSSSAYLQRLRALRDMLESVARAEDIVKVYEARLTEKETTSLTPGEVEEYVLALKKMKLDLDQKKDVLASMESELAKASHWNGQVSAPYHRCDMMLSKYTEQVNLLSDRWRRILGQIDTRVQDLQTYQPQLQNYKQTSTSLSDWIDATRRKQDILQSTKIESIQALQDQINNTKALNGEIKTKRGTVDSVLKDNDACVISIKDYETDLNSYTSGLETLLNIPIKRTMLKSPSMDLNLEATQLQTRYMELLTQSGDYYKFLGELLKNMEELKIRNTRIDLLEEELRQLRDDIQDRNAKNKSLEDSVSRIQLELSNSKDQLLSMEVVKQSTALQVNATKESLDSTQGRLADLNEQVARLTYLLEEEKRKKRLAEERYTQQQEEYESVLRRRQKELETVSWSKVELEKSVASKEQEIDQLRRQLADEAARVKELQKEISKVRSQCSSEINNLKLSFDSQIQVSRTDVQRLSSRREEDSAELRLQYDRVVAERMDLEDELMRLRLSMVQVEEQRKRAEEEAASQRTVITEEGRRRRELESKVEGLIRQRGEDSGQFESELADVMKRLEDKSEELVYVTHSLEEETRRRKTIEEGQGVLEQSLSQMQSKLSSASMTMTQLRECKDELEKLRLELERESREKSRVEQNMSRLQGRMKELQAVRDGLESQVENLREANKEELARRKQLETEMEKATTTITEYNRTITTLRQTQESAGMSERKAEGDRLRLQGDLEESLRQNKISAERMTQLSAELKALQQQLLQEQARVKEANLKNESLYKTIEERNKVLNESSVELQRLKEMTESQTKERLRLEEELRTARHEKEELSRSKQGHAEELSSQITSLQLQLQTSERSNVDYRNLVSELSSEREKIKLEAEKIQKQANEITATMQSIQSKYNDIVSERDDLLRRLQMSETDKDRLKRLEDELNRLKLTLESELRNKQRLQEESDRLKKDVTHWKDQYESKQDLIKQYDADKDRLERDKNSLKSEIDRLMRELRELEDTYKSKLSAIQKELRDMTALRQNMEAELRKAKETPALDASSVIFDGVRKKVTADQLLDCGVLDKPTFSQLAKGHKTVPEVSADKKINLKGTGPIAGVVVEGQKGSGSANGLLFKMTFAEAKKDNLLPPDSVDLLLDAQAATGHIIDPRTNQKYTVAEACDQGVVDEKDRGRLLAAEAAAVGFSGPTTSKPLSAYEAMKTGLIDKNTTLRLLQAQESTGGILDPALSVFLPKDIAIERNLIDDNIYRALNQRPELYLDPESEEGVTYMSMKRRCKVELNTGLLLLPVPEKMDTSKLVFEGVRKPVTAKQLVDCGVLDKPTLKDLEKGKKSVPDVSLDKKVYLKGTGSIAGVAAGPAGKMSFTEAKKQKLMPADIADLLLDAQAATGHIIDPTTNEKLTVDEACARGVVDRTDLDRLLAAEAAAVGYRHPGSAKPLSVFEAMKKGLVDQKTGLRLLQAQESAGGILDPNLSVFLPKETAIGRNILDDDLSRALNKKPECYLDPDTQDATSYVSLKKKCKVDPRTGLLLLPEPKKPVTVQGLRDQVSVMDLVDANLLKRSDMDQLRTGRLTSQDIEKRLSPYLRGSTCIAGIYEEVEEKVLPIYEAMKEGLLRPGTTLELLEAQAASGFIVDPVNNHYLSVDDAYSKRLFGPEYKDNLLSAERAVTGYKLPGTDKTISLFQAIERGLVEKGHGIRLLEAQIASGGIIDPEHSHRIDVDVAYKKGYFDEKMNRILSNPTAETKGFFDPNTEDNLTYMELKKRCITDKKTGLILLPVTDKSKLESTLKNTLRRRRVIIVDPETNREMTVREAYDKGLIDYDTFIELSEQECEWEEITITAPDGSISFKIVDKKTGREYDITEMLENGLISQSDLDKYKSRAITITQFADILTNQTKQGSSSTSRSSAATGKSSVTSTSSSSSRTSASPASSSVTFSSSSSSRTSAAPSASSLTSTSTSSTLKASGTSGPSSMTSSSVRSRPLSPTLAKMTTTKTTTYTERSSTTERNSFSERSSTGSSLSSDPVRNISSVSISLGSPIVTIGEQEPVGAIFDTETLEKISITEALDRGLVDTITAQRLLEAQACTGGIVNPANGRRLGIQEASRLGIIDEDMAPKLKPAQKAFMGFEDLKTKRKMSAAEAMKEKWLPYEAGQRFLEFQFITGGFQDPEKGCRRTIQDALSMGWLEERSAQKLQDPKSHTKNLTCPKTKLKISYKDALDNCLSEESTGVRMLPASSMSSSGISSPYNMSSAPGSTTGSRSGSRRGSRRGSLDLGSPVTSSSRYTFTSISSSTK
ncbi:desmoplakin isoform X1 [Notolabrus celidotus]|uniref:desmoplakin isoform X1 n=1 Tax=Notolabrus celidotus TaxID=1203425 RepID=UPI0014904B41|nr:desmoplakin isoform X1 [Notolabrus celidotus]